MTVHRYLDSGHRLLARSGWATRAAVLLRNQCGQVVRYRLGQSNNMDENGERLILNAFAGQCIKVIDVGANIGDWTEAFLSYPTNESARVLAFEPQLRCVQHLRDRFGSATNVEIVQAAVGDAIGELTFFENVNSEHSSLVPFETDECETAQSVPVTTLDKEVESRQWQRIDLLKVDTEGYDMHVLEGASQLLRGRRIGCIQFEYNRPWALAGSTLGGAFALLQGYGYRVFLLQSTGLFDLEYQRYGEYYAYSNFVAVSTEWENQVQHLLRGRI